MSKDLEKHTEEGFVRGFHRYLISEMIVESKTWKDLEIKLEEYFEEKGYLEDCYDEYRILNIALQLQQRLCEILGMAYKANHLKKETLLKSSVVNRTRKTLGISTTEEALSLLEIETNGSDTGIYTPHALLYVASLTLGQVINYFRDFINIPNKEILSIADDLSKFNTKRNELVHNLFSSRIAPLDKEEIINSGINLINQLDEIHREYLFSTS